MQKSGIFVFEYICFYIARRIFGNSQLTMQTMYLQLFIISLIFIISYHCYFSIFISAIIKTLNFFISMLGFWLELGLLNFKAEITTGVAFKVLLKFNILKQNITEKTFTKKVLAITTALYFLIFFINFSFKFILFQLCTHFVHNLYTQYLNFKWQQQQLD